MLKPKYSRLHFATLSAVVLALTLLALPSAADTVSDWNKIMNDTVLAGGTNPLLTSRIVAIVQASVFDSVNGIERRYTPIHVTPAAPRGASRRAAAIQAAYATLAALYPAQASTLAAHRAASLAAIVDDPADVQDSMSIANGIEWGQTVAEEILAWRAADGITPPPPPFLGGNAIGEWRPTPPGFASGAGPQFATMTTWVIDSPSQFRPAGPPALSSAAYATALNEVKSMGIATGSLRTTDQTNLSIFWNGNTALYWNRVARAIAAQRNYTLSQESLLFGVLNVSMADAAIACWDAKYHFVSWRPVTAIRLADQDGNPATDVDLTWTPLLITPAHPEYPSGHSTVSGAAARVLAVVFGDKTPFTLDSELQPGVLRSYSGFSAALAEVHNARVFGGIHFRPACIDGSVIGRQVADQVMQRAFQRLRGGQ